jgi:peptide deformylase
MTIRDIVQGPHPELSKISADIMAFDAATMQLTTDITETLAFHHAVGIAAPMFGVHKRIIAMQHSAFGVLVLVNPLITTASQEMQEVEEASLCYPGISAKVTRPARVTVAFQDTNGTGQSLDFEGFEACVVQHEMDYLDGKVYLDYLTPLKKRMLLEKMQKLLKQGKIHVHSASCNHG